MSITVKKLAKLSGVSVRTLRYYDEINLLKPAYYGDNQYRYYEEEQLLLLQQILFYRELGFALNDIKAILEKTDFCKIKALKSHKECLKDDIDRTKTLIKTIDKTIAHLGEKQMLDLEEIFDGLTAEKRQHYEEYLIQHGVNSDEIAASKRKVKDWTKEQWLQNKKDNDAIFHALVKSINARLKPDAKEVQDQIRRHYELTKLFWTPTQETYINLGKLYRSNPDFEAFFDNIHPQLLDYITEAMTVFAEKSL